MKKILEFIKSSMYDLTGKPSSNRISSYFILGSILTSCMVFILIDIGNALIKWNQNEVYEVPVDHIALFSMILAHHLVLLGLKRGSDIKVMEINKPSIISNLNPLPGNTQSFVTSTQSGTQSGTDTQGGNYDLQLPDEPPTGPMD